MTTSEMIIPVLENNNMTQIFLTILFYIFVIALIGCAAVVIVMSLVPKSLLCAKIYIFIFEHDDWLLYKKAKKQGIQHYLNGCHFSQFYKEWNKVKDEYGVNDVSAADYLKLDKKTTNALHTKYNELAEKYHYKEYNDTDNSIKDDDIVLSLNMYSGQLCIGVGDSAKNILHWKPMVKDIIKREINFSRGYSSYAYKLLLTNPKEVISF